jgi:hypothetical protein
MPERYVMKEDPERPGTFVQTTEILLYQGDRITYQLRDGDSVMIVNVYRDGEDAPVGALDPMDSFRMVADPPLGETFTTTATFKQR